MALALLGKVILGSMAGLAAVTSVTYFSVKGISSTSNAEETFLAKNNCGNLPIKAINKEKIIVCGLSGGGNSNLTFYLHKDEEEEINSGNFDREKMSEINSLSWKGKKSTADHQSHILLTLKDQEEQSKIISKDNGDYLPNQDIEDLKKCSLEENTDNKLRCQNTENQGVSIEILKIK